MKRKRITILLFTFVAAGLTSLPALSVATASEWETKKETIRKAFEMANCAETVDYSPAPIVIKGVQYSVKDGLEYHTVSGILADAKNWYQTKDWWPHHNMYLNWGSSRWNCTHPKRTVFFCPCHAYCIPLYSTRYN